MKLNSYHNFYLVKNLFTSYSSRLIVLFFASLFFLFGLSQTISAQSISVGSMPIGSIIRFGGIRWVKISSQNDFMAVDKITIAEYPTTFTEFTAENCQAMPLYDTTVLIDNRDGKGYRVRKMPDGNCWMIDNLAYGGTGANSSNDACTNRTAFSGNGSTTATNRFGTGTYGDCRNNPSNDTYGYLYNWQAAVQDSLAYFDTNYQPTEPLQGLCPDGWLLPTGGANGDFATLNNALGGSGSSDWRATDKWAGVLSGYSDASGMLDNQGTDGHYWSSTQVSATNGYALHFNTTAVYPQHGYNKYNGFAIRCLKASN